jgi:hypothetical protein
LGRVRNEIKVNGNRFVESTKNVYWQRGIDSRAGIIDKKKNQKGSR